MATKAKKTVRSEETHSPNYKALKNVTNINILPSQISKKDTIIAEHMKELNATDYKIIGNIIELNGNITLIIHYTTVEFVPTIGSSVKAKVFVCGNTGLKLLYSNKTLMCTASKMKETGFTFNSSNSTWENKKLEDERSIIKDGETYTVYFTKISESAILVSFVE
jgi:hypothetical protein